jgi:serine/threonine protein kinase
LSGPDDQNPFATEDKLIVIVSDDQEHGVAPTSVITNLWVHQGGLYLIVTRFLKGNHYASHPGQFVRIIEHLQELHERGFVHGDIRGFNTVFSDIPGNCRLIDFDFGGRHTATTTITYPVGYTQDLPDGSRVAVGGEVIEKWHDWYALVYLLFHLHDLDYPPGVDMHLMGRYNEVRNSLKSALKSKQCPTEGVIEELKTLLTDLTDADVTCSLLDRFEQAVLQNTSRAATQPATTGSPVKNR